MIKFIEHNAIDKNRWDYCIQQSISRSIFAEYDFLSIVNPEWEAIIEENYKIVMPLFVRKKWGIQYLYIPSFVSVSGIFSEDPLKEEDILHFIEAIPKRYKQIDILFNTENDTSFFKKLRSFQLNLNNSYTDIYNNFSKNCKRNIKESQQWGLQYLETEEIDQIVDLFRQNRGKSEKVAFSGKDYDIFKRLVTFAQSREMLEIYAVLSSNGEMIAGAVMLKDYQATRFWFSGRSNRHAEKRSMFFLINQYIENHSGTKIIFDFNGSMNENIARFYRGFGGIEYSIPYYQKSRNRLIDIGKRIIRKKL